MNPVVIYVYEKAPISEYEGFIFRVKK